MTPDWLYLGLQLLSGLLGIVGGVFAFGVTLGLRARVRSLEFDVASLEDRLLREIKTRASHAGVKSKKENDELAELIVKEAQQPAKPKNWWDQYVHPDLRQS